MTPLLFSVMAPVIIILSDGKAAKMGGNNLDFTNLFRDVCDNGYRKEDVVRYINQMKQETQQAQAELKEKLEQLTVSKNELSNQVSHFSQHVGELEDKLQRESKNLREVTKTRDQLYLKLEQKQQELDEVSKRRKDEVARCKAEISEYLAQRKEMQDQIEELGIKGKKFDEIQSQLKNIRKKAESDAFLLVDNAKVESMEAVSVIDDVEQEVSLFKSDIGKIRADFEIGTKTLEDRLDSLYYALERWTYKLHGIKTRFYQENHLTLDEGYDYVAIDDSENKPGILYRRAPGDEQEAESE